MKLFKGLVFIFTVVIILSLMTNNTRAVQGKDDLIRFHVIANSDSPEDQELKNLVRDRLLQAFFREFQGISMIDEGREKIIDIMDDMEKISREVIDENGKDFPVYVELGYFDFPTRMYGNKVYSAGNYEALRVVIGEGAGSNWWCVMFPPLCFVDITHGVAKDEEVETTSDVQYKDNTSGELKEDDENNIKYSLKITEWWNKSKLKIASIFSSGDSE